MRTRIAIAATMTAGLIGWAPGALAQGPGPKDWEGMVKGSHGYTYGNLGKDIEGGEGKARPMPQVSFVLAEVKYGSAKPKDGKNRAGAHFRQTGRNAQIHYSIKLTDVPREIVLGRPMSFKAELKRMARFTGGKLTEYNMFGRNEPVCAKTRTSGEFTNTAMGMRVNGRALVYAEGNVPLRPVCDTLKAHQGALDLEETVSIGASLTPTDWSSEDSESKGRTKVYIKYKVEHSLSGTPRRRGRQKNPTEIGLLYFKLAKGNPQDFKELVPERVPDSVFLGGL